MNLPNGCKCSKPIVIPRNWKSKKASLKNSWLISYRFYDPSEPKPKQVAVRGMNHFQELKERQQATEDLLNLEMDLLIRQGYNPFRKEFIQQKAVEPDSIGPTMSFSKALWEVLNKINATRPTINDMRSVIRGSEKAMEDLSLQYMMIGQVSRKHIKAILAQCAINNPRWSPRRYNLYRAYLMRLFKELVELEAIDYNPVRDISTMKETRQIREVLTDQEREKVNAHLKVNHFYFWRFIQIFFRSGARETEMVGIKFTDVDLPGQRFKVLIKKGKVERWVWKTIADSVLPLWEEVMNECNPDSYLFSEGLKPGPKSIRADQIGKRWRLYVKRDLGIKKDLYGLKHLNASEIVDSLGNEAAAAMMSHTSTAMTTQVYDIRSERRRHEQLKKVGGLF